MLRHRRLAGCVPIRRRAAGTEVMLITSRSNPDMLVFPKGGVKHDETPQQAALRETFEEAGVRGTIGQQLSLADWAYDCDKSFCCEGDPCEPDSTRANQACRWYLLEVGEQADEWPERDQRTRTWLTVDEALKLDNLKGATRALLVRLDEHLRQPPPSLCIIH